MSEKEFSDAFPKPQPTASTPKIKEFLSQMTDYQKLDFEMMSNEISEKDFGQIKQPTVRKNPKSIPER